MSGQSDLPGDQVQQSWQLLYLHFQDALPFLLLTGSLAWVTVRLTSPWGVQGPLREEGRNPWLSRGHPLNEHLHGREQFIESLQSRKQRFQRSSAEVFAGSITNQWVLLDNEIENEISKILYDAYTPQAARKFEYGVRNCLNKLESWPEENRILFERLQEKKEKKK